MALSKALSLTLEALLERCATRAAAAETAAAKPNLTKAAEEATTTTRTTRPTSSVRLPSTRSGRG